MIGAGQRTGWAALINYFVFEASGDPVAHLPEHVHSIFGQDVTARQMEQYKDMFRRTFKF